MDCLSNRPMNAVCTLFEGDYHLGAAALLNSLHRAGFAGTFVCGHRGPRPVWHAVRTDPIEVRWVEVSTPVHLTNYKPAFLQQCWSQCAPNVERVFYFDPDIVVKCPWSVVERWATGGLALCEDTNAYLPPRHPYRLAWHDFFARHGLVACRELGRYHNAGFLGLPESCRSFLDVWQQVLDCGNQELGLFDQLKKGLPHNLFYSADQDALNMALLLGEWPLNTAGSEGMDFQPGGHLLSHAAGGAKPWRGRFLRDALCGRPPGQAQKAFHEFLEGPIRVFPPAMARRRKLALRLAALIGRFYRRGA